MKIAVMGAGGIGGYVGGRLADAGEDVTLIARGRHLAALRENGLRIESPLGDADLPGIPATDDPAAVGPVDLILFTVKLGDAETAAAALGPMVGDETVVVTLQNGIDSRDILGAHVDAARVSAGIIYLAAHIEAPGVIGNPGGAHRVVTDGLDGNDTVAAFCGACDRATGIEALATDRAGHMVWEKFIALVAFSGVTSIARLPIGAVFATPATLAFMEQLLAENIAVARARGLDFGPADAAKITELLRGQPYGHKTSMLVDLEQGRALELPWLSGRVADLGDELGIATPANDAVVAALAAYVDGAPDRNGGG